MNAMLCHSVQCPASLLTVTQLKKWKCVFFSHCYLPSHQCILSVFYLGQEKNKRKWRMDAQTHGFITGGNDASKNIIFTGFLRSWDEDGGKTMVRSTYRWMGLVGWMERISSWSTRINNYFGRMHCNNDCLLLMHYSIQIGTLLHVLHGWSDWECVFECLREKCSSLFLCPIFWAITFENCDGKSVFSAIYICETSYLRIETNTQNWLYT